MLTNIYIKMLLVGIVIVGGLGWLCNKYIASFGF